MCVLFVSLNCIDEFMAAAMAQALYTQTHYLIEAFAHFDTDKSGTITRDELKLVLGQNSDRDIDAILQLVDTNNDGEISFEEFSRAMTY
jgi:Ca2+-binding EF-hand superfamily protein